MEIVEQHELHKHILVAKIHNSSNMESSRVSQRIHARNHPRLHMLRGYKIQVRPIGQGDCGPPCALNSRVFES
jgi:hypothetical protein